MLAAEESLGASFGTEFAESQDLTQHSLLSFNLFKVKSPASVFVSVTTPHGVYRTPPASLFEQANTITVDLASAEFASAVDAAVFDEPIIGLSAVKSVALHLVAAEIGGAQVTVDSMVVCAAPHTDGVVEAASATPLEFPDVASLSTALTTALGEVQRLAAEVGELKNAQRRARRSFDEFSASVRETIEQAVGSLSTAMSANVEQTLTNAKLLQRLRERIAQASEAHESRIVALDEQFASLRSLSLKQGESVADGVTRIVAEERASEIATLQKRSAIVAESVGAAVEQRAEASIPVVGESFGLNLKKAKSVAKAAPVLRAP
jgi:hypothetical protein